MLPLIFLPGTDLAITSGEMPANTGLTGTFTEFNATFAALLHGPVAVSQPTFAPESGELLPVDGNTLPESGANVGLIRLCRHRKSRY